MTFEMLIAGEMATVSNEDIARLAGEMLEELIRERCGIDGDFRSRSLDADELADELRAVLGCLFGDTEGCLREIGIPESISECGSRNKVVVTHAARH